MINMYSWLQYLYAATKQVFIGFISTLTCIFITNLTHMKPEYRIATFTESFLFYAYNVDSVSCDQAQPHYYNKKTLAMVSTIS